MELLAPVKSPNQRNCKPFCDNPYVYDFAALAEVLWRDCLVDQLGDRLNSALFDLIRQDRVGGQVDETLIRDVLLSYVRLGINKNNLREPTLEVYQTRFEAEFLDLSSVFYTAEAQQFVEQNSILDYMRHADLRLRQEERRTQRYLHSSSREPLMRTLVKVLVENWTNPFQIEFQKALEQENLEDLASLYNLLHLQPGGTTPLYELFEHRVTKIGLQELQVLADDTKQRSKDSSVDPKSFVSTVLQVYRKFRGMAQRAFNRDAGFVAALDKASRLFLNVNAVTSDAANDQRPDRRRPAPIALAPRLLAAYCDLILKKGSHQIKDEREMEDTLTDLVALFRYLPDKDVFMMTYSKLLSKRLLTDASASEDAESSIVQKLKQEQGFEYSQKLLKMISDIQISRDLNKEFQEHLRARELRLPVSFSAYVIATGSWPVSPPRSGFNLPAALEKPVGVFLEFYNKKHGGRKLTYLHELSRVEVENRAAGKVVRLSASAYQAAVLLLLNDHNTATLKQINDTLGVIDETARAALFGLVKSRTLLVTPPQDDPLLWIGESSFAANSRPPKVKGGKVNVNLAFNTRHKAPVEDQEIERNRAIVLRSWIVKLMKAQSSKADPLMPHNDLLTAVTEATRKWFLPQPAAIKKAIESLIQDAYIQRAKDEAGNFIQSYLYLA